MRRSALSLAVIAVVGSGCGDDAASPTATETTRPAPVSATTSSPSSVTTTTPEAPAAGRVVAISSGRGDDGSFEVIVWLDEPLGDVSVTVGLDSSVSYSAADDPFDELEGWVELGDPAAVVVEGEVVASGDRGAVGDWVSWVPVDETVRVFLLRQLAPLTGAVWVALGDARSGDGVAGARVGETCLRPGVDPPAGLPPGGSGCFTIP